MTALPRGFMAACAVSIIVACGDPTAPPPGALQINVATTGGDPDPDGYELFVGAERRVIAATNSVVLGLAAGSHVIELKGVASNCTVTGDNPRSVVVVSGGVTNVNVTVGCDPTGISLELRTIAPEPPVLGYTIMVGGRSLATRPNDTLTISGLAPGTHTVTVTAVPEGCTVAEEPSFSVTVTHRVLTPATVEIACGRYENMIAFTLDSVTRDSYSNWIAVTRATEGAVPTLLFRGYDPSWSPDGKKLVYSTTYCDIYYGQGCSGGLSIVDYSNGRHSAPAHFSGGIEPAWSPDGKTIAFLEVGSPGVLGKLKLAGMDSPVVVLSLDSLHPSQPSWSPDGEKIVFACGLLGTNRHVCRINRDGTGFVRLTSAEGWQFSPTWSPDGSRIAFAIGRPNSAPVIAVMNPDGTDVRQLGPGFEPSWSPDGSKLVFARGDGLFVMGPDGSSVTRISTGRHHAPTWRP